MSGPAGGMPAEPRPALHLTSQRAAWWMLLPAAFIGLTTVAVWLSQALSGGGDPPEADVDWIVPAVSLGGITTGLLLLWVGTMAVARANERRKVLRVLDQALVRWPQYATEAQWRQVIAKDDKPGDRADAVWPTGIITAVVALIAVPAALKGLWDAVGGLVAFWLAIGGLLVGRHWNGERERRADRRRRENLLPYPSCWLAAEAFYHEDWGLITLDRLTEIRLVAPDEVPGLRKRLLSEARKAEISVQLEPLDSRLARTGWSLLLLTFDERVVRTLYHQVQEWIRGDHAHDPMPVTTMAIRVPSPQVREAAGLTAAVSQRWLAATGPAAW